LALGPPPAGWVSRLEASLLDANGTLGEVLAYEQGLPRHFLDHEGHKLRLRRAAAGEPRFRAFGIGDAKSGTSSLASMLLPPYRAAHEPNTLSLMLALLHIAAAAAVAAADQRRQQTAAAAVAAVMAARQRQHVGALELDVSFLYGLVVPQLRAAHPTARFVLTLRDPISHAQSKLRYLRRIGGDPGGDRRWRAAYTELIAPFMRWQAGVAVGGLAREATAVWNMAPRLLFEEWCRWSLGALRAARGGAKLLVLRTDELSTARGAARLARFLGVPAGATRPAHRYAAPAGEPEPFAQLPQGRVDRELRAVLAADPACREQVLRRYFPEPWAWSYSAWRQHFAEVGRDA
jgi:hypothetical protein